MKSRLVGFLVAAVTVMAASAASAKDLTQAQVKSMCTVMQSQYEKQYPNLPKQIDKVTKYTSATAMYRANTGTCHIQLHYEVNTRRFLQTIVQNGNADKNVAEMAEFYRTPEGISTMKMIFRSLNEGIYENLGMNNGDFKFQVTYMMDTNELPDVSVKLYE